MNRYDQCIQYGKLIVHSMHDIKTGYYPVKFPSQQFLCVLPHELVSKCSNEISTFFFCDAKLNQISQQICYSLYRYNFKVINQINYLCKLLFRGRTLLYIQIISNHDW